MARDLAHRPARVAYEVHIIREDSANCIRGVSFEAGERLACNADFGAYAWSFGGPNRWELALEKFEALQQRPAAGMTITGTPAAKALRPASFNDGDEDRQR